MSFRNRNVKSSSGDIRCIMQNFLLLIVIFSGVSCKPRPESQPDMAQITDPEYPTVEVQKQDFIEIHPEETKQVEIVKSDNPATRAKDILDKIAEINRQIETTTKVKLVPSTTTTTEKNIEERTKEILDKIAEVNRKHGLTPRKKKPPRAQFPFGYYKSSADSNNTSRAVDFKFSHNPFKNPIFDYLERKQQEERASGEDAYKLETSSNNEPRISTIDQADQIPGHYIKRKITHQQTFMVPVLPNSNYQFYPQLQNAYPSAYPNIPPPVDYNPQAQIPAYPNYQQLNQQDQVQHKSSLQINTKSSTNQTALEGQTVSNIRNIIANSQVPYQQIPSYYNHQFPAYNYPYYSNPYPNSQQQQSDYRLYGPFLVPNHLNKARQQQFQWPWQQLFPIVIRDPMVQMMNAITSMVEYGPNAMLEPDCKKQGKTNEDDENSISNRTAKKLSPGKLNYKIKDETFSPELTIYANDQSSQENYSVLDIEDLVIKSDKDNPEQLIVGFNSVKTETREPKKVSKKNSTSVPTKLNPVEERTNDRDTDGRPLAQWLPTFRPTTTTTTRRPVHDYDDDDIEINSSGKKKLFSKDNTGSGIFIHRLKVRKGGVAIAGPGGIATAGSGGTAIVGPNGYAYTHPDSLAIAGSGTKVVAVDPIISLSDIINNSHIKNRRKGDYPRIGKVVAVGPVVYYNKG